MYNTSIEITYLVSMNIVTAIPLTTSLDMFLHRNKDEFKKPLRAVYTLII